MSLIPEVKVVRRTLPTDHENQKFFVIEGSIEGFPAVTKVDTISMSALASGAVVLADRVAKMKADVAEYYANVVALESLPESL